MQLIRAIFYKSGRITKRGYRTHANDNGKPLCRVLTRENNPAMKSERCEWISEFGTEPTCTVCARMVARQRIGGGAA